MCTTNKISVISAISIISIIFHEEINKIEFIPKLDLIYFYIVG